MKMTGNGNCFPWSVLLAIFGNKSHHTAIRMLLCIELIHNKELYMADKCVAENATVTYKQASVASVITAYSEAAAPHFNLHIQHDLEQVLLLEAFSIPDSGVVCGNSLPWQTLQNVLFCHSSPGLSNVTVISTIGLCCMMYSLGSID